MKYLIIAFLLIAGPVGAAEKPEIQDCEAMCCFHCDEYAGWDEGIMGECVAMICNTVCLESCEMVNDLVKWAEEYIEGLEVCE